MGSNLQHSEHFPHSLLFVIAGPRLHAESGKSAAQQFPQLGDIRRDPRR
jgi:hypothetical protein